MKKLIFTNKAVISLNEINDQSICGVKWRDETISIIVKNQESGYTETVMEKTSDELKKQSILECLEAVKKWDKKAKVYVFETLDQAKEWMDKDQEKWNNLPNSNITFII